MKYTEWIDHKTEQISSQSDNLGCRYRQYMIAIYHLYYQDALNNPDGYSTHVTLRDMINAIGEINGYDYDDDPHKKVVEYKKTLTQLGYIHSEKHHGQWRIY